MHINYFLSGLSRSAHHKYTIGHFPSIPSLFSPDRGAVRAAAQLRTLLWRQVQLGWLKFSNTLYPSVHQPTDMRCYFCGVFDSIAARMWDDIERISPPPLSLLMSFDYIMYVRCLPQFQPLRALTEDNRGFNVGFGGAVLLNATLYCDVAVSKRG